MFLNFSLGSFLGLSPKESNSEKAFRLFGGEDISPYRKYLRKGLFYLKVIIYSFSFLMISWSFFQHMFTSYVGHSKEIGIGLEAAFPSTGPSSSGDLRYDAFPWHPNPWAYWPLTNSNGGFGPYIMWFVYPISRLFLNLIWALKGSDNNSPLDIYGLNVLFSIIIVLLIMKSIVFLTIFRAQYYSDLQQRHKKNLERIKSKYNTDKLDRQEWRNSSILRQKEIGAYCRKHGLKPYSALENFFINTPIFMVVYKLMTITKPIKHAKLFGFIPLSQSPGSLIIGFDWRHVLFFFFFFALAIPINLFSQRIPSILMKRRFPALQSDIPLKIKDVNVGSSKKLQNIISIALIAFSLFWSTSLAIYYFFNSLFNIFFSYIIHAILKRRKEQDSTLNKKLKNLGI
ncbi:YidC/Oxa1 family membrane protein insertase [Mycoplasma parvum]|uniref:Membrane insertase YidC/Oxa/ALB C-terminal domain-containing protein n=1 Tax=Mycoplasma parvum str. Indiana TaxID=1403316 RepID=U5NGP0_9MOLU|nr:YidC/Oxa1 family membrane protein insertase [Mycoplasma parvum]AGX89344.1 hypothetical protein PRV_03095 [Mycoplasma parvum str. Indiana]